MGGAGGRADAGSDADAGSRAAAALRSELLGLANEAERLKYRRYFPEAPDGEFAGVRMGAVFGIAKTALDAPADALEALLDDEVHEVRALACSIMGKSAAARRTGEARREQLFALYLRRHDRIDRWDLVDLAAAPVVGGWLLERDRSVLDRLAASARWPERRTALVATFAFLKRGETDDAVRLCRALALDDEPYVAKAVGWVLRSVGDLDRALVDAVVAEYGARMPREALRAALEHYPAEERRAILAAAR